MLAEPYSEVAQARLNARLLELLEECLETPERDRLKAAYSDKLITLCALCATTEFYFSLVETYGL